MIGKRIFAKHAAAGTLALATVMATTGWAAAQTVCYVNAADSHAYATPANEALVARAGELGIEILSLSQDFDVQKGTEQLNTCVARGVDGIILWPLDPQAYIPGLARAQQANIPAILINSPIIEYSGRPATPTSCRLDLDPVFRHVARFAGFQILHEHVAPDASRNDHARSELGLGHAPSSCASRWHGPHLGMDVTGRPTGKPFRISIILV
jgi:hypothetical protein